MEKIVLSPEEFAALERRLAEPAREVPGLRELIERTPDVFEDTES